MPPRRAVPPSPVTNGRAVAPSPTRSTRSTRSRANHDDWENESVDSSFPAPATARRVDTSSYLGLKDTSVNIAGAFNAAQAGASLPTPTSDRPFLKPRTTKAKQAARAASPSEQLQSSARALSPVRFFLRPGAVDGDPDASGEYSSFGSLGNGSGGETSYDYQQEEAYMRAAQASAAGDTSRTSDGRRRKSKAMEEERAYRPEEDEEILEDSEDSEEGEGIVRAGGLDGRAGTRGKRKEKGEGYLGMGLGIQPRTRSKSRRGDGDHESDEEEERVDHGRYSPLIDSAMNGHRTPTPARLLRALSPRVNRTSPSPAPSRRRQPHPLRTVITNILHGIAIVLKFFVDLITGGFVAVGRGLKYLWRAAKSDWWKWLLAAIVLSFALRYNQNFNAGRTPYHAPEAPPGSMDELVARLTAIENTLSALSASTKASSDAQTLDRRSAQVVAARVGELESAVGSERKALEAAQSKESGLATSIEKLRHEVRDIAGQVGKQKGALSSVGSDIEGLKARVTEVEKSVREALDDGRVRSALERLLPTHMPVRTNSRGTLDIEPSFWAELRRVFVGQGDVENTVRRLIASGASTPTEAVWNAAEHEQEMEAVVDKLFNRRAGTLISREEFLGMLEAEITSLRNDISSLPLTRKGPGAPAVTIKTAKGEDVTSALQALIDAALLRYSKDTIARRDYALLSAGGRVVPEMTSETLVLQSPGRLSRFLWGTLPTKARPPSVALQSDSDVGMCWPFAGDKGRLGVMLAQPVVIGDITLEHVSLDMALDVSTAPKDVEIWTSIDDDKTLQRVNEYRERNQLSVPKQLERWMLLANVTYDPYGASHIQTFPVAPDFVDLGIVSRFVEFKFMSNWGADTTCVYRVRVHGESI